MDLVRELKDVRFELSLRGYDCEAVDAFLAKLRGDISSVQAENESAVARIRELEQAVSDGGGASSETEGTLRRTLVLAQRLADETEAEAKKDAADMLAAATADTEQMRAAAEVESRSMKEEGKRELDNARNEAATIRETVAEEAARTRADARAESETMLAEAERRGMERVAVLEQTAQVETAAMREPIRAEVVELEQARARVMADIAALETHLEQQRVRVRTAVEALRVGMSGSIEDLERVADDDELLATQDAPAISGARAGDVEVAPDIEIVDSVGRNAPPAPSVDDIEVAARATAAAAPEVDAPDDVDDGGFVDAVVTDMDAEAEVVDAEVLDGEVLDAEVVGAEPVDAVDLDEASLEEMTDEASLEEMNVEEVVAEVSVDPASEDLGDDVGPNTEPIPIVAADDGDVEMDEVVQLEEEPTALFGTDLAQDVAVDEADVSEAVAADADADDDPVTPIEMVEDVAAPEVDTDTDESPAKPHQGGTGFVQHFAELLDTQPISRDR